MLDVLLPYLPDGITPLAALGLVALSAFTSGISAAIGLGGGVMMLAVMAMLMPPAELVPVHGVVQLGSNSGRAVMMRRHVVWAMILPFAIGSAIGALIGAHFVMALPVALLQAILSVFLFLQVWGPKLGKREVGHAGFGFVGLGASFCTMFLGATGPMVASFLKPDRLGKHGVVSTHAAAMVLQHGFKVLAFWSLGFAFWRWLPLVAAMITAGIIGTSIGTRLLDRVPERVFALGFKIIITALAAKLGVDALGRLMW
jgi:uncharacterized membrane protein YfcA